MKRLAQLMSGGINLHVSLRKEIYLSLINDAVCYCAIVKAFLLTANSSICVTVYIITQRNIAIFWT